MRLLDRDRVLWIDSVCIDQDNRVERGHQVQMMYNIYSNGQRNLIYLGETNRCGRLAKTTIRKLLDNARDETNNYQTWDATLYKDNVVRRYCDSGIKFDLNIKWLLEFYSAPWFGSLWVRLTVK